MSIGIIVAKGTVKVMSTLGIGTLSASAVSQLIPAGASAFTQTCCKVGGIAVGCVVADKAEKFIDELVNELQETHKIIKDEISKIKKEKAEKEKESDENIEIEIEVEEVEGV